MFHRDQKAADAWETLCSIESMTVKRFRMNGTPELAGLSSGEKEQLVVATKGGITVLVNGAREKVKLAEKDLCYIPKGQRYAILKASDSAEVVVASAPAAKGYPRFVKRFAETAPIESGKAPFVRRIYNMVTEAERVNRFLAGFVEGNSGNWTSFPPHRHDGKPEVYVYYGMGKRFGVQIVVTDTEDSAYVVRDGDAVVFEKGYHPNVAAPGTGMNFLWIISAPPERRDLSVEFHPAFEGMQSGPTHLKTAGSKGD